MSGHGYRLTDSSPDFDPVFRCPSRTGTHGVLSGSNSSRLSPVSPPLILPVVEEIENDPPTTELDEIRTTTPESGVPPPPGFPPFLFPENDGGVDADDICARFGGPASLTFPQISRELSDISHETEVPEAVVPRPPSLDSSSEVIVAVGYAHLPLPSVNNAVMPELVRMPALPQPIGRAADREVVVPRWRLAREGPFLEERSAESIRSLGPGTPHTVFRTMRSRRESTDFS